MLGKLTPRRNGAFTLIELLVVIGIIGILIAATLVVGTRVVGGGKERATHDTLKILDSALQNYIQEMGEIPPPIWVDTRDPDGTLLTPVLDARNMDDSDFVDFGVPPYRGHQMLNSAGMFMAQARTSASATQALERIPSKYVAGIDPDYPNPLTGNPVVNDPDGQAQITTPRDAWGNPFRYNHPAFDGSASYAERLTSVQTSTILGPAPAGKTYTIQRLRRNSVLTVDQPLRAEDWPDSDGGICPNNRPYFYSAGPDGKVGYRKDPSGRVLEDFNADNVYLVKPQISVD